MPSVRWTSCWNCAPITPRRNVFMPATDSNTSTPDPGIILAVHTPGSCGYDCAKPAPRQPLRWGTGSKVTHPVVLAIETSCDETGIGIVAGTNLLAHQVASSMDEHVAFGGVIPEIAARAHVTGFLPVLDAALEEAKVSIDDVDAIAVTAGPGLAGALMVGVAGAKALALATGKPLYGINHLIAHIGVGYLDASGADLSNVNQL